MTLPTCRQERHCGCAWGPSLPITALALPAAVAAPAAITFDGLEVTQAVQDMAHTVPLVAQKATVVRVYLGTQSPTAVTVRGVLLARANHAGSAWPRDDGRLLWEGHPRARAA